MYIYEQICKHVFETRTWIDIYIHVYKDRDVDIYEKCFYVHTYMYIKIGNGGVIQGMGDVDTYIPIRVDIQEMGNPFPVCHVIHINVYTCICLYVYMYVSTSPFPVLFLYTCMYVRTYVFHKCPHLCLCIHVCIYPSMSLFQIQIVVCIFVHIYTFRFGSAPFHNMP